jgi:hypothetical protein
MILELDSKYPITLRFIDNTFFNNYDMLYGVIRTQTGIIMNDKGSTYYNNVGNLGSAYYFSINYDNFTIIVEHSITGIKAYNNYAKYGGVMYIVEASKNLLVSIISCTFNNNQASKKGGTMFI